MQNDLVEDPNSMNLVLRLFLLAATLGPFATQSAGQLLTRITSAVLSRFTQFNSPQLIATDAGGNTCLAGSVEVPSTQSISHFMYAPYLQKVGPDGQVAFTAQLAAGLVLALTVSSSGSMILG